MSDFDIEKMSNFFDKRAETYEHHMLNKLELATFYETVAGLIPSDQRGISLLDLGCGTGILLDYYKKIIRRSK